jgi:hypothetical protein
MDQSSQAPHHHPVLCMLAMIDNTTSTVDWLKKFNLYKERDGTRESKTDMMIKRKLTHQLAWGLSIHHKVCLYSQWFPGKNSGVVDSCSRDFEIPDNEFVTYLRKKAPPSFLPL